jgi:uncharacterized membrane protein YbhN (UPF0104 family)
MSGKMSLIFKTIIAETRRFVQGRSAQRLLFLVLVCLGLATFWYVARQTNWDSLRQVFSGLSWRQIAAIPGFVLATILISAFRWHAILRGFGYQEPVWKLMKRVGKASAVSFVVPSFEISSETFKGLELQRHGVSPAASFASVFFDFILVLIINLSGGLLVFAVVLFQNLFQVEMALIGACLALAALFVFLRRIFRQGTLSRFLTRCIPLNEKNTEAVQLFDYGLSFFLKESRRYLIAATLITVLGFVWELVQVFLVLRFLGVFPNITQVFVFYLAIYFFNSVPVFGGLGFGEAGAFLSGSLLGVPSHLSLALALILRSRQIILLVFGGTLFMATAIKESLTRLRSPRFLENRPDSANNNHQVNEN